VSIKIDGFMFTGSMGTARSNHTATLLSDGKVLVAGGFSSTGALLASAEVYNPATGTFAPTANNMPNKGAGHAATLLTNGKVLVTGGGNSSTQLYDPATNSWSSAGGMSSQRSYHTATRLANGRVLIAGGSGSNGAATNTAQIYDPVTGNFAATGNMTSTREFHTATLLANGKVLIAGGRAKNGSNFMFRSNAELYDPATGTFTQLSGAMTAARYGHIAAIVATGPNAGKILIAGGANAAALSSAELFDPVAGTFSATGPLAAARQYFTATIIASGVLAAGGVNNTGNLGTAEQYQSSGFVASGTLRAARASHSATLLNNGSVLIVGGAGTAGSAISSAELFTVNP
jgi:N-acetylneuraminic acid mutarotase